MAALIGALRVSLSADTAAFHKGMAGAERRAKTTGTAISKSLAGIKAGFAGLAAGLSIGLLTNAIKGALDYAGALAEVAQQVGVTTKDLQVFRYAAGQLGVGQAELEKGLGKLTITLGQVAAGAKAPTAALDAIGISAKEVAGLDTGAAFRLIADGLEKIPDRAQRAAVEVALFGRAGAKLDTLLSGGSKALNQLSAAAEKLGIVLSDEQIAKADETADKLDALKTVLSAQIAGVVADNANAILGLADALISLVSGIGKAMNAWRQMEAQFNAGFHTMLGNAQAAAKWRGAAFRSGQNPTIPGKSVTIDLAPPKPVKMTGGNIKPFLASGGGGSKKGSKGPKDNTARDTFQFEQDMRRTQIEVLRAQQDLATDYVDRVRIGLDILTLERKAYEAELAYEVASGDLTETRAKQLLAEDQKLLDLKRDKLLQDEEFQRRREYNELAQTDFDIQKEGLEAQAQLAETASERRDIELRLLDLAVRQERARLEAVIADEQSGHLAQEEARRRLAKLDSLAATQKQGVVNSTRGPLGSYMASLPSDAAKMNEALEQVAVNGLQSLEDGLLAIADGTKTVGQAFKEMASGIIADLLRIQIRRMFVGLLSGLAGGIGGGSSGAVSPGGVGNFRPVFSAANQHGWATGGFTGMGGRNKFAGMVHGQEFVLNADATRRLGVPNLNALNSGAPMAAVSNDNTMSGPRGDFVFNNYAKMSEREARRTGMQAASAYRQESARSAKIGV